MLSILVAVGFVSNVFAANCFEADRLANTKAALVHYFTKVDGHSCKKAASSDIYLGHTTDNDGGKEVIEFFIKCDQEYPVLGKIYWFDSVCASAAAPAHFTTSELVP